MKRALPSSKASRFIRNSFGIKKADLAVVLGSGWSDAAAALNSVKAIPYTRIPGMGGASVKGHTGLLHLVTGTQNTLVFQGRRHFYEGAGWDAVLMPVYIAIEMGVKKILLTNAAGAISPSLKPGSIMLITDHINMMGSNPLIGPHNPALGERFPDQTEVYSQRLRSLITAFAKKQRIPLKQGVYIAVSGPTYETPAEIRAFRKIGADAIGMSTVPEAMVAGAAGLEVCAISCIANSAAGAGGITHQEVLANSRLVMPNLARLIGCFCNHQE